MSPSRRTDGESTLIRDVALVCLADGLVGVSFGATTVAGHLHWWVPVAMSLLVFAGGSQFAAVGVVLSGGSPFAAVAAGAVLNTRLLPYGFAVADVVGPAESDRATPVGARRSRWRWLTRLAGAQMITDESTAFALRQGDAERRRAAFWTCGLALFAVWNVAVVLGVLAGSVVRNTNAFGLDATFPAVLIALALPALAEVRTRISAGTGAVIAVALTPVLPAGLPVLAALAGLGAGWRPWRRPTPAAIGPRTAAPSAASRAAASPASTAAVPEAVSEASTTAALEASTAAVPEAALEASTTAALEASTAVPSPARSETPAPASTAARSAASPAAPSTGGGREGLRPRASTGAGPRTTASDQGER
jgi:predicted branched-subunit amino acid permease